MQYQNFESDGFQIGRPIDEIWMVLALPLEQSYPKNTVRPRGHTLDNQRQSAAPMPLYKALGSYGAHYLRETGHACLCR